MKKKGSGLPCLGISGGWGGCVVGWGSLRWPLRGAAPAVAPAHTDSEFRLTRPPGGVQSGPRGSDRSLSEPRPLLLSISSEARMYEM